MGQRQESSAKPSSPLAVVVSTWVGNPDDYLSTLLTTMDRHPAGAAHDLYVVANGTDYRLPDNAQAKVRELFVRENRGYNLAAWDHAWHQLLGHEHFLFLQDDCFIRRAGWLADMRACFERPGTGLVGENLIHSWDRPWSELFVESPRCGRWGRVNAAMVKRARRYHGLLESWGVPAGETARHLTTVVHYTSRQVLEDVGGYRHVTEYEEAIAAEIGFSRMVEACGYRIRQVGRTSHSRIGHREWRPGGFWHRMGRSLEKRVAKLTSGMDRRRL